MSSTRPATAVWEWASTKPGVSHRPERSIVPDAVGGALEVLRHGENLPTRYDDARPVDDSGRPIDRRQDSTAAQHDRSRWNGRLRRVGHRLRKRLDTPRIFDAMRELAADPNGTYAAARVEGRPVEDHEVRILSDGERADSIVDTEDPRRLQSDRPQRVRFGNSASQRGARLPAKMPAGLVRCVDGGRHRERNAGTIELVRERRVVIRVLEGVRTEQNGRDGDGHAGCREPRGTRPGRRRADDRQSQIELLAKPPRVLDIVDSVGLDEHGQLTGQRAHERLLAELAPRGFRGLRLGGWLLRGSRFFSRCRLFLVGFFLVAGFLRLRTGPGLWIFLLS